MEFISQSWNVLQVVLGIGIVIFVHEAGHFLAARWCGVRVDVFSLGFGPKLFGWRRGATLYQVAAVPLGGYVKMAGEELFASNEPLPSDDLRAKSVGQRFLIFSGGVIMNVIFALVIFPIIFTIGVPFDQPRIGDVEVGGPTWQAGIEPGSEVVSINGHKVISYLDIHTEVALSPEGIDLELREPLAASAAPTRMAHLIPVYDEYDGRYTIGISNRPAIDPRYVLDVRPDSPAAKAGLQSGDRLVDVESDMPEHALSRRLAEATLAAEPFQVTVERAGQRHSYSIEPVLEKPEGDARMLGIRPVTNRVRALRSDARLDALGLLVGDQVLSAQGRFVGSNDDLVRALTLHPGEIELDVERDGRELTLTGPTLARAEANALAHSIALELDPEASDIAVLAGSPALAAGLQDGDEILQIDGTSVKGWEQIRERTQDAAESGRAMVLRIQREGPEGASIHTITATPTAMDQPFVGAALTLSRYVYRSANFGAAIVDGGRSSWKFMTDAWMTLKRILRGQVSGKKNLGGIITISVVSYSSATVGFTYLLFFLCLLSVNLAFLNVLPIPILDGGHLFFLIIEKIKGSPVSERVLGYSQMVGLVMIVSLMIYVTFNDVMRWFFDVS